MLDSDRKHHLSRSIQLLVGAFGSLDDLVSTLKTMQSGFPGGHGGAGSGKSDRTGEAGIKSDPARDAMKKLDHLCRQLHAEASALDGLRQQWLPTQAMKDSITRGHEGGEPGCEIHLRFGRWEAVDKDSDVNGNLPRPYKLCRWCYQHVRRTSKLPPESEMRDRMAGKPRVRCACLPGEIVMAS